MIPLAPVPGDPQAVLELAARCVVNACRLEAIADLVRSLHGATWDSPAGSVLGADLAELVPVLSTLSARHGQAGSLLRSYAADLADLQDRCEGERRRHGDCDESAHALRLAVNAATDETSRRTLTAQAEWFEGERAQAAMAYAAGRRELAERESGYSIRLAALTEDGLSDPVPYRAAHLARSVGDTVAGVGAIPGPWSEVTGPVGAVAGAVAATAGLVLKAAYDEGSWGDIGASAALSGTGALGGVLKAAARAGGSSRIGGAPMVLSTAERLRRGATSRLYTNAPWRLRPRGGVEAAAPTRDLAYAGRHAATGGRVAAAGRVVGNQAYALVDRRFLADLRTATANGPAARRLLLGGWAAEGATKVGSTATRRAKNPQERG